MAKFPKISEDDPKASNDNRGSPDVFPRVNDDNPKLTLLEGILRDIFGNLG